MEAKNADLSALRIDRAADPAAPTPGARRWLVIGLPGAAGVGLASLLSFARVSTLNFGSFSEIGFGFALSPGVITSALIFAVVMGVVGGFLPAVRAARLNIVNALRAS